VTRTSHSLRAKIKTKNKATTKTRARVKARVRQCNEARVEIHSYQKALEELNAKHTEKLVTITADVFNAKTILFKQG